MTVSSIHKSWLYSIAPIFTLVFILTFPVSFTMAKDAPVPVIHCTDLFRPHEDPDDHWDLATVYSLAYQGEIRLLGIVIDYPPEAHPEYNPDVQAVSQMNSITGLAVPVVVGSPGQMKLRKETRKDAGAIDRQGIQFILDTLQESPVPVVINIIGSCRSVALAGNEAPELFQKKCRAIYLNAGSGTPNPKLAEKLEYNVSLGSASYAAIFDLPCPVYWMPCFEDFERPFMEEVRELGTHFQFRQNLILTHASQNVQNFFLYMLTRNLTSNWLVYLKSEPDEENLKTFGEKVRHMYCTGGFLHSTGKMVDPDGRIVSLEEPNTKAVFTFDPISVECKENGVTLWHEDADSVNRWIYRVRDTNRYQDAMTAALKELIIQLP